MAVRHTFLYLRFFFQGLVKRLKVAYSVLYIEYRIIAIYAPMIYTAQRVMFMKFRCVQIQHEGKREGVGPVNWHQADRRMPFGAN
jgi:hypothetical protein